MKDKKTLAFILITLTLIVGVLVILKLQPWETKAQEPTNDNEIEIIDNVKPSNGKKLSCYDAINTLLEKDGFKYIEGTRWGRGEKNFFNFDLSKLEFQVGDFGSINAMPDDWYNTFYSTYINYTYSYGEKTLIHQQSIINGNIYNLKEDDYTMYPEELNNTEIFYYEIPIWMDYYASQFEKMGCSNIQDVEILKNTTSNYRVEDIVSVFDVKSTDGVVRTYNDVHVEGNVKDHPRYREIQSFDEFYELKDANGFESMYMLNIINSDTSKTFEKDTTSLQSNLLVGEFVKDVVYAFTPERNDAKMVETLGVYFLDIDNKNGNFKSIYRMPINGQYFELPENGADKDIRNFEIPFEATIVSFSKNQESGYEFTPFNVFDLDKVLDVYLTRIKIFNDSVVFSEDFVRNYTRPFAYDWQARMGLTKLFDEKYGLVDHSIQYMN